MSTITDSKIFQSSTRKDKIIAAIQNPINSELVEQVRDYLDDEFLDVGTPESKKGPKELKQDMNEKKPMGGKAHGRFGGGRIGMPPSFSGGGSMGDFGDTDIPEDNDIGEFDDDDTTVKDISEGDIPDDATKDVEGDMSGDVESATDINIPLEAIQGTLNSRQDCAGVSRVVEKDNELWIYYSDVVNLNNAMTDVIDHLISQGYSYLEFNRLARSNNAIVFDVLRQSINNATEGDASGK